jgi:hypothetical protein
MLTRKKCCVVLVIGTMHSKSEPSPVIVWWGRQFGAHRSPVYSLL